MTLALLPYEGDLGQLKEVFAAYPSGLAAIGAQLDGDEVLMIASSFTVGVSYDPPLCSVAIQKSSQTWSRLRGAERVGVSALGADHASAVRQLASRDRQGRLAGLDVVRTDAGALLLGGAAAWFECRVRAHHDAGDHTIALLEVVSTRTAPGTRPLVLHHGRVNQPARLDA